MTDNLTFVTHLRFDDSSRLENLQTVVNFYSSNFPTAKFVFVEDDSTPNPAFKSINWPKHTTYFFIENKGVYHRTFALNYGINYASTDIVVSMDTDCIVQPDSIRQCIDALNEDCTIAWPYNGTFINIKNALRTNYLKSDLDFNFILNNLPEFPVTRGAVYDNIDVWCINDNQHKSVGGFVMFNKNKFKQIGLYNQNFVGWGYEDNELVIRCNKLNHRTYRSENEHSICFHLNHSKAQREANPLYAQNMKEAGLVTNLTPEGLAEYIKTWKWIQK